MQERTENGAWIEPVDGKRVGIEGTCSIGRAPSNQVVLGHEKVSRRHVVIHAQEQNEFWLVDLGSSNGTYLNGKRVTQSIQLHDGDRIEIGPFCLMFGQPDAARTMTPEQVDIDKTVCDIKSAHVWLLVTDIESSTQLSQRLPAEELPVVTGRWFDGCKHIVDKSGGAIDKYLGDGFLAYWRDEQEASAQVAKALEQLKIVQSSGQLTFRVIVHFGQVFTGGVTASGVERLFGPEVNFIFKLERLASALRKASLMSQPAYERIRPRLSTTEVGPHELAGFSGRFQLYSF